MPFDELEKHLIGDLECYFLLEKTRENDILSRRLGINCDSETLEGIGKSYNITRERIRQIELKAKNNFIAKLSISPKVIWAVTKTNLSELRAPFFPLLRKYFNTNINFYAFLEVCCALNENEIRKVTSPNLNKGVFEEFWVWNKSPANIEDLSWYLHENMNVELAVAENQIFNWIQEGILERSEEEVKPLALPKVAGIANALLDFPNGDSYQNIQKHANDKNITSGGFYTDRQENTLGHAADKEYLYQNGRGTYKHIFYLNITDDDKQIILHKVHSKLNEHKHAGRDSVNLHADIFIPVGFSEEYFTIRHIVRAFGESCGVYFNGKSGADTVSLDSEFSLASQKTVLVDLFKKSLKPLSKVDVASKIRSQSLGHASFYLEKLLTDGEILRIDETHYAHRNNAFIGVDIEGTLNLAFNFIDKETRIVEGEKIQSHLNKHLDNDYNKYFYISLLKLYAADFGKNYFFRQNLISKSEIKYTGLSDICREALDTVSSRDEAYALASEKLCVHRHVLKRCFDQVTVEKPIITSAIVAEPATKIENCRILIGHALDNKQPVYWEYGNKDLANRHLIVFGRSGQGKTYCIQGLLMEMAKHQLNSMVIDYTNGFLPEQLEPEFKDKVQPRTDLVVHKPLDLNPFNKQVQEVAGFQIADKSHDVASRVASVFNAVYSDIGSQQLPTLIKVIEEGLDLFGGSYSFDRMLKDLQEDGKHGETLANKLNPMVRANLFSSDDSSLGWEGIFKSEKSTTRLIQLARLSRDIWRLATEFILWDLYSYACTNGDKNNPLPVVLDEVQNLDHRLDSPLGKMLTEGRKYGLSLILATQTLSNLKKDEQDRLFQAAHKLFFAPAETEIDSYAKLLEQAIPASNKKAWLQELASLKKGECISVGLHMNENGVVEQGARVVKVASLGDRLT